MSATPASVVPRPEPVRAPEALPVDPWLWCPLLLLVAIGVVMVGSASMAIAEGHGVDKYHYLVRHLAFVAMGSAGAVLVSRLRLQLIERNGMLLLLLAVALLLAVWVPGLGRTVNGATRWVDLGISSFQVGEAAKLLLVLYIAGYLVRRQQDVQQRLFGVIKPLLVTAIVAGLLLVQPDFGSAVLIGAVTLGMLWLAGAKVVHLLLLVGVAIPVVFWLVTTQAYRLRRFVSFLDPWERPWDEGFQLTQALIAIGRGEWFGVGIGGSIQKLFYLPEAHTDFIFAVYAEETGLLGVLLLLGLFALLIGRMLQLGLCALERRRMFAAHCVFGIALLLAAQTFVSIGVNMGVLPTKGLTLPLVSSGGSSVLMTLLAFGVVFAADREVRQAEPSAAEPAHDR